MIDISYLKGCIRGSIVSDVINVAKLHSLCGGTCAGWFGIPRQVFCYVDFLGSIAYNNIPSFNEDGASTRKAVRFIKEFFPKCYRSYANLLIAMWRHGTVHNFKPFVFYTVKGNKKLFVEWTSNRSDAQHNRVVNMCTYKKKGCDYVIILSVNICQLADDLLYAFDLFVDKMETNQSFMNGCIRRLKRSLEVRNCMSLKKIGKKQKDEIRKQILHARDSTDNQYVLNDNGQLERYSKKAGK